MADTPHRTDSWIQWALLILTIMGALWNLSGRLSGIEQQLRDDANFHATETGRLEGLEKRFDDFLAVDPYKHVAP